MKKIATLIFLSIVFAGCASNTTPPAATESEASAPVASATPAPEASADALQIDEFALDEISGAGCGMALWKPGQDRPTQFVFFNGLEPSPMEMKINGQVVEFKRVGASGEEFYGQMTSQTFESEDGSMTAQVDVELGEPGEIESVAIDGGTVSVMRDGQETSVDVVGDAGC